MNDAFFRSDIHRPDTAADNLGGFCESRIHSDCLRISADGQVQIQIESTAKEWFDHLSGLGEVLHLAQNPAVTLGSLGQLPKLADWSNPVLPRDLSGFHAPNLAEYARLSAVRDVSTFGARFGLEVSDVAGMIFERVLLTGSSSRQSFEQFVIKHQAPAGLVGGWYPPNHTWSKYRRASILGRISWLQNQRASGVETIYPLPVNFPTVILTAAAQFKFPIRTTFYSRALIRTALWIPRLPEPANDEPATFFECDDTILQLHASGISSAWLWTGKCQCCERESWSIEIGDADNQVGLSIMAGYQTQEADWRNLLQDWLP